MEKNMLIFNEDFIKSYDENSNKGYILEVDIYYSKEFHEFHSNLPLLAERIKINKYSKLACNLYDKNNCIIHIRALKQAENNILKST